MSSRLLISIVTLTALLSLAMSFPFIKPSADELSAIKDEISELTAKLQEIQGQKQSLAQTVSYLNTRVQLTESQISQTEQEINNLEAEINSLQNKIGLLDVNLDKLSEVLVNRIAESYKTARSQPTLMVLLSGGFEQFLRQFKYLKVSQQHDREVIYALEEARANYDVQKTLKETKQQEVLTLQAKLVSQKTELDKQKSQKQAALNVTQNDEKRFQELLASAMAEMQALQSIIAGKGSEVLVGPVSEGDVIASIIPGPSTCSTGAHLHFEVVKNGGHINPASVLSPKSVIWDNAPDGAFGFSGSWRWPIDDPIRVTQGYGQTFFASTMRYYGGGPHTGIDMISSTNYSVRSVQPGTLYRGSIGCKGGILRYVHVKHADSTDTYYLHVNY